MRILAGYRIKVKIRKRTACCLVFQIGVWREERNVASFRIQASFSCGNSASRCPFPLFLIWSKLFSVIFSGWLKNQLKIQADGLSGYLSKFWVDVANSSWIGGKGDTGLHERTPYWLNGFVPLAFQLERDNLDLLAQVHKYLDYILSHQSADGWLGPEDDKDGNMYWSKFPMLFALLQVQSVSRLKKITTACYFFL